MKYVTTFAALFAFAAASASGQEDEATLKLREALRNTMLQLRDAQGQIANLQASEIAAKREIESLQAEVKKLNASVLEERNTSANAISGLSAKLSEKDAEIAGHRTALEKWRKDYTAVIERARKAESERDRKTAEALRLERLAEDQRVQNIKMYRVGMEVLDRYDKFWFGDALLAREPFVGNTKVKLQNLAQDGQDKLLAARIREEPKTAAAGNPEKAAAQP